MSEVDNEIATLDEEFAQFMQKLEQYMIMYNFREKYIVTEWITKLKNSKDSVDERKLRNRFIKHFVNKQESAFNVFRSDPFNNIPTNFNGPLIDLKKLLPKDPDEALNPTNDEKRAYMAELFDSLHDKGAFLSQQPVPRSGSFFILVSGPERQTVICQRA